MRAAVVTAFGEPPRYGEWPDPVARASGEVVVEVLAAGLHPRVRSQAAGSHYTSTGQLPIVPGIDAVVRDSKGKLRYTILDDTPLGTMAARTVIELDRSVVLPDRIDPVLVAAAMNPVMSSWVALRRRIEFRRGPACGVPPDRRQRHRLGARAGLDQGVAKDRRRGRGRRLRRARAGCAAG